MILNIGQLAVHFQGLENLDRVLKQNRPHVVFDCNEGLKPADVVCRTDGVRALYQRGSCVEERLKSACCREGEGCCGEGECVSLSNLLENRTTHWQKRLAELEKIEKVFPSHRLERYQNERSSYGAAEVRARASLGAARISIEAWAGTHRALAKSVEKVPKASKTDN